MGKIKRFGVLTGGGDCPGLNAVIRAVVKSAIHNFGMEVLGIENGFEGLVFPGKIKPLGYEEVKGILPRGGTILGSSNRANPFAMPIKKPEGEVVLDCSKQVMARCDESGIEALVVIGGDGTLKIAKELKDKFGLKLVGIPKTIDNDLSATDVTFGFDSAVQTATEAIDKLHTTAESHHRVMLVEVMGRDVGWIALHSGLAGGADAILIPEIPYYIEKLVKKIEMRESKGRMFSIVVVAEGARPVGGKMSVIEKKHLPWSLPRLGGAAERVAEEIERLMEKETRVSVLGHIQRGGSPTPFDRNLGTRFGVCAVNLISEGKFGQMVCLRGNEIKWVELPQAVGKKKLVEPKGEMVMSTRAVGVDFCSAPEK